ncbi:MAG: hypothetical protein ACLFPI_01155 [Desulfobacterales bacterium]
MKVKDFGEIRIGHAFRERLVAVPDGEIKVIQPRNILPEGLVFGKDEPLRTDINAPKPLQRGDVLVVNRGRFAATVFDLPESDIWIVPSSVLVLSIFDQAVMPEYVALYFNSGSGQKMFRRHLELTTVSFISAKNLGEIDIQIPLIKRQKDLIAFEKDAMKYTRLSNRKQALLKEILNNELNHEKQKMTR